jgi:hypothetical protein
MVHLPDNQAKLKTFCEDSQLRYLIVSKSVKKLEDGTLEDQGIEISQEMFKE